MRHKFHSMLMRLLRSNRNCVKVCCAIACCLVLLHFYTNVTDLLLYYLTIGLRVLPLSLHCNAGRLGNQMCTYSTLYGLSALNDRRPFVALSCNAKFLRPLFPGLSVPKIVHESVYLKWHPWKILPFLKPEDGAIPPASNFIEGYIYPCSYTFFDHVRDEIREEFRFNDDLQRYANDVISKANVHHLQNVTYVGVHVRRGDYQKRWLDAFEGATVNFEYFHKAFSYFRDKYTNVVFVAVSDDRLWCIENLSVKFGVYVAEEAPSPAHDMAILANCDHTVMTYGTFGFWGAYLAGGEVVYYDKFLKPGTKFTKENFIFEKMYPPLWKGIATVNSSHWATHEPITDSALGKRNKTGSKGVASDSASV